MRKHRRRGQEFGRSFKNDLSLIPPIRQTASIFKQPVTVIKTQTDSKTKSEPKQQGPQDKPKQVFGKKVFKDSRQQFMEKKVLPM